MFSEADDDREAVMLDFEHDYRLLSSLMRHHQPGQPLRIRHFIEAEDMIIFQKNNPSAFYSFDQKFLKELILKYFPDIKIDTIPSMVPIGELFKLGGEFQNIQKDLIAPAGEDMAYNAPSGFDMGNRTHGPSRGEFYLEEIGVDSQAAVAQAPDSTATAAQAEWKIFASGEGQELGKFYQPSDVVVAPNGDMYVVDSWNHRIQKWNHLTEKWEAFAGRSDCKEGHGLGEFDSPVNIVIASDGSIYVLEAGNNRIQKWTEESGWTIFAGTDDGTPGQGLGFFDEPGQMAFAPNGDIYVLDLGNNRIQKWNHEKERWEISLIQGWPGIGDSYSPKSVAVAKNGDVYATVLFEGPGSDSTNKKAKLLKYDRSKNIWQVLHESPYVFRIAFDRNDNLFGINDGLDQILKYDPSQKTWKPFAGDADKTFADGLGEFFGAWSLFFDENNNLWVAERNNNRIQGVEITLDTNQATVSYGTTSTDTTQTVTTAPKPAAFEPFTFDGIFPEDPLVPEARKPVTEAYLIIPGPQGVKTFLDDYIFFDYTYDHSSNRPTRVIPSWGPKSRQANAEYANQQRNPNTGLINWLTSEEYDVLDDGRIKMRLPLKETGQYRVQSNGELTEYTGTNLGSVDLQSPRNEMYAHEQKAVEFFNEGDYVQAIAEFTLASKLVQQVLESIDQNRQALQETLANLENIEKETKYRQLVYTGHLQNAVFYDHVQKGEAALNQKDYFRAEQEFRLALEAYRVGWEDRKTGAMMVMREGTRDRLNNAIKDCQTKQTLGEAAPTGEGLPPGLPGADTQPLHHSEKTYNLMKEYLAENLDGRLNKQGLIDEATRRLDDVHYSQRTPELLAANAQKIADRILTREGVVASTRLFPNQDTNEVGTSAPAVASSATVSSGIETSKDKVGGIDFNAKNMNVNTTGDKMDFALPEGMTLDGLMNAEGLTPVIINMMPVMDFMGLLGLNKEDIKEEGYVLGEDEDALSKTDLNIEQDLVALKD
jgi:tetratricopeptide (TPR) repeat protein